MPTQSPKGAATRKRLTESMLQLIHTRGYHGAGLNTVVEESGAPKGSLYFHFPGGKSELGSAAVGLAAAQFGSLIVGAAETATSAETLVDAVLGELKRQLVSSDYHAACPIAAVTLDAGADDERLRGACGAAYASWVAALEPFLRPFTPPGGEVRQLAYSAVSLVEGALIIGRAQRSTEPLEAAAVTLKALLGAVGNSGAVR